MSIEIERKYFEQKAQLDQALVEIKALRQEVAQLKADAAKAAAAKQSSSSSKKSSSKKSS
tara:strand:- start:350 stop:529 length:180 start_codon:yes stop_codon:yes gene_type:complete